jgi:DHA1 family bicyclomycin/chloramphenicol resistance-like MFS transporter
MSTLSPVRAPSLAILIAVTALSPLSLQIIVPTMPALQLVFDTSVARVQLTLSLYLAGFALAQLAYGPISDRFGRRPTLLAGLALFIAGSAVCLMAPTIEWLIAGRILQAVGGCAGMVLSRAIVRDVYGRDQAASMIAYITMGMVVAPMLAPALGGVLKDAFGWWSIFAFTGCIGVLIALMTAVSLNETHRERGTVTDLADMLRSFAILLRMPAFNGYAFQVAFTGTAFFAFVGGAPYVMVNILGRTATEFGLFFITNAAAYMAGNFIAARYSARAGGDRMITIGTTLSLVGAAAMTVVMISGYLTAETLFGCMAVISVGNGLSQPNGRAGAISVDPNRIGAASGLSGFLQMGLAALVSYAIGLVLAANPLPLGLAMLGLSVLAFTVHQWGLRAR